MAWCLLHPGWAMAGTDAVNVFKAVSPGIVCVRNAEGSTSGVLLNRQGLVLTTHHMMASPLPVEALIEVKLNGRSLTRSFKNVKLEKVHKTYNLAFIRVSGDLTGASPVSFTKQTPSPGAACYAVGNTSVGRGGSLQNSISQGLVSGGPRDIEGGVYIQTSAPFYQGHPGGALCGRDGKAFGVMAFTMSEKEGLAFAIPWNGLKTGDFVPPDQRADDLERVEVLRNAMTELHKEASDLPYFERQVMYRYALELSRLTLSLAPRNITLLYDVASAHLDLKQYAEATAYANYLNRISPDNVSAYYMLGQCAEREGRKKEAWDYYYKGIQCRDPYIERHVSLCAEKLAFLIAGSDRYEEIVYFLKWADLLPRTSSHPLTGKRKEAFRLAYRRLSPAKQAFISKKTSD
ncbi:MAG: tetratricopeptide repeat-containing serine protease family protein, partial [Verrucomicrobiota bacterium]